MGKCQETAPLWVVLSDIHANWAALKAVLEDAKEQAEVPPDQLRYISLGDVIDYGPQPFQCLQEIESLCVVKLCGNHDIEGVRNIWAKPNLQRVQQAHWPMTVWTRWQLQCEAQRDSWPELGRVIGAWKRKLGTVDGLPGFIMAHVDLSGGEIQSLGDLSNFTLQKYVVPYLRESGARYALVGHTHVPAIYYVHPEQTARVVYPSENNGNWYVLQDGCAVINPGSVGQPRRASPDAKADPRASYLLIDARGAEIRLKFRRVEYARKQVALQLDHLILPSADDLRQWWTNSNSSGTRLSEGEIERLFGLLWQSQISFLKAQVEFAEWGNY